MTAPQNLYNNVTYMYPNSNIWLIGKNCQHALCVVTLIGSVQAIPSAVH